MKCTSKEQDTCNVEKRGCEGCYYDDHIEQKRSNKTIKEDCFAYKNENGCEYCNALKVLDCNTCEFYRDGKEINIDKIENDIANYSC